MAYPTSLDAFTNPNSAGGDTLATVPHDTQHGQANDAIEALEAKVGIDGSAVTTSLDYILQHIAPSVTFALPSDISPPQITAAQDNYNPTGLQTSTVLRLSTNASWNMTGLTAPTVAADGNVKAILNVGSFNLVLKDLSTSSSIPNRFALGADITLTPSQGIVLWYDTTSSKWRPLASVATAGGGGGAPTTATYVVFTADGTLTNEVVVSTGLLMTGTNAARPAAGTAGRYYNSTDLPKVLWRDDGAAWQEVANDHAEDHADGPHTGPNKHAIYYNGTVVASAPARSATNLIDGLGIKMTAVDNAGTGRVDVTVGQAGLVKSADQVVISSAAAVDDTHLQNIALDASSTYLVEVFLLYSASVTGDFQFTLSATNTPTGGWSTTGVSGNQGYNVSTASTTDLRPWDGTSLSPHGGAGVALYSMCGAQGFLVTGVSGSVLKLRWAQNVSDATNTTVRKGSFIRYTKLI